MSLHVERTFITCWVKSEKAASCKSLLQFRCFFFFCVVWSNTNSCNDKSDLYMYISLSCLNLPATCHLKSSPDLKDIVCIFFVHFFQCKSKLYFAACLSTTHPCKKLAKDHSRPKTTASQAGVLHGLRGSEDQVTSVLTLSPPHSKYQYKNILRGKRQREKYSAVELRIPFPVGFDSRTIYKKTPKRDDIL